MNEVFLFGKVIQDIEYKFVLKKHINAKAKFKIQLLDKQILNVTAYNEIADEVLKNLKERDDVFINGRIENNVIIIKEMELM